jgi:hypothetical protein
MRLFMILVLSGTLAILGCDSTSDGTGGSGGSGGSGGTGGTGGTGGSGGGTGGGGGEAGTGGGGGGGGASAEAMAFCTSFEVTCSYGSPNYDDRADCLADYDSYDATRQECVMTHLTNAENSTGAEREAHCGHASGLTICS